MQQSLMRTASYTRYKTAPAINGAQRRLQNCLLRAAPLFADGRQSVRGVSACVPGVVG